MSNNRFINTNLWIRAVKYVIYVHYETAILTVTHTTQGDAKTHPPYDDRIIARRPAGGVLLMHHCDSRPWRIGPSRDIVAATPTLHVREH